MPMSSTLNATSSANKNRMEVKVVGSRPTSCMFDFRMIKKKEGGGGFCLAVETCILFLALLCHECIDCHDYACAYSFSCWKQTLHVKSRVSLVYLDVQTYMGLEICLWLQLT